MKDYYYEDFEVLSQTAREVWLAEQCSAFETQIQTLSREREKDHFLEELYRKLKQVTRRWQSWNHRSFGGVISRGYVAELASWERNVQLRGILVPKSQSNSPESNVLQRFDELCMSFENLLERFRKGIYQPLSDFFQNEKILSHLKSVPKDLEKVLTQWNALLTSGAIDEKLFSRTSAEGLYPIGIRNRIHDYDLVLRLIPDLTEKAYEALRLARRWRLIGKTSAIQRDETYIISREQTARLHKRRTSKTLKKVSTLEEELEESKAQCISLEAELNKSNAKCEAIEKVVTVYRQQCNQLENELDAVKRRCESLKEQLENAKKESRNASNEAESSQEHCRVLQQELNSARLKYCTQKVKFINTKKRCSQVTTQLNATREQLTQLQSELEARKKRCQALQVKLENSKKNIFTQGNMLDVLQNQCYMLKEELDGTKAKCLQLTCELEKSQDRCSTLEKEVKHLKEQYQTLETELRRAKTREELLVQQNTQLRKLFQDNGMEEPNLLKVTLHAPDTGST
ncbi:golgin subfamily A member 1-like isoform X2 [Orbicella faveolata]|uniref:golgin subfamily A member 1-like isoform X2 n=1 Tax=Orbicella faveolata TaxID=48498 RepID=UPI0009E1D643|nr:golgin subfamily A member 1-like isoform X2 [Orbicella faveolata]